MSLPISLNAVVEALDNAIEEQTYYLDKRTGEILLITNEEMEAAEEDEAVSDYPEWQRESILKAREIIASEEQFVSLPDRLDINEYEVMESFCLNIADRHAGERLLAAIKGKGAFGRFKNAINSMGIENDWYDFKRARLEEIAIEWLDEHDILYSRDDIADVSKPSR